MRRARPGTSPAAGPPCAGLKVIARALPAKLREADLPLASEKAVPLRSETEELGRSAYRWQLLENAVREHELSDIFRVLRSVNIEPILLKGWSVARLYKDPATRPLGDIDLLLRDELSSEAER